MKTKLVIIMLGVAVVLAGCATPGEDGSGSLGDPSRAISVSSPEEARALLAAAASAMPDDFGMRAVFEKDGESAMTLDGHFDRIGNRTFVTMKGDFTKWAPLDSPSTAQHERMIELLKAGITMYATSDRVVYLIGKTAWSVSPRSMPGMGGQNPFSEFTSPASSVFNLSRDDVTVLSFKPVMWKGKPAVEMVVQSNEDNSGFTEGKLVVYTTSKRIAHMEMEVVMDEDDPFDDDDVGEENPLDGAVMKTDFLYDGEIDMRPSPAVLRAVALSYTSDAYGGFFGAPFGGGGGHSSDQHGHEGESNDSEGANDSSEDWQNGSWGDQGWGGDDPSSDPYGGWWNRGGDAPEQGSQGQEDWWASYQNQGASREPRTVTWTFDVSGGIALADVVFHVKGASDESDHDSEGDGMVAFEKLPTLWTFAPATSSKTHDGVTLTYLDADEDGKVSQGDTLKIRWEEGREMPTVALFDNVTGTYVVPGPGLWMLTLLGAAAFLLRRK